MNKRQKIVQQQFLDNEEAVLKRLKQVYGESLKTIDGRIEKLMKRFDPETGDLPQSAVYQIKYQKMLKGQIEDILTKLQTDEYLTVADYLDKCYEDGFVGTLFDLQGQGVPMAFPLDQEAMVRAVQLDSKISQGLYTKLGEDVALLKKKITAQVSRGIATGMSFQQVAKQLAGYTNIGYNRAVRIARTEGHRIQCQSTMDACYTAKDKGADVVKQWNAALDARTRESHAMVDGEIRELDEKFSNGLRFPGDPSGKAAEVINCRCALNQRARWALSGGITKMNNFTKQFETFESPEAYNEFKKAFFSKENRNYMNYVQQMEEKYGTKKFEKVLDSMTDREYNHYSKLLANNPMFDKKAPKVSKPTFTPAKTREEAEGYARNKGVKYADYKGLPIETANALNMALDTLPDDVRPVFVGASNTLEQYWGGKLKRRSKDYYGVTIDTFDGVVNLGIDEITGKMRQDFDARGYMVGISSSYTTPDKIKKSKGLFNDKYTAKYPGHTWFFNVDGETTPVHEMGHVYAKVKGLPKGFDQAATKWATESKCDMLTNPEEAWSEAWASYHTGVNVDKVPDDVLDFIRKVAVK